MAIQESVVDQRGAEPDQKRGHPEQEDPNECQANAVHDVREPGHHTRITTEEERDTGDH